jgi:RimJ/RimL family protein N-acetyltransferase
LKIEAVGLENAWVRLEPCAPPLKDELRAALDVEPEVWAMMAGTGQGEHFEDWWQAALTQTAAGTRTAYAVRRLSDGALVGTTSLYDIRPEHRRCELGATFYRPDARGGVVNPSCKRLLLEHAFEAGALRVEILTDALNARSRAAIEKLGARFEGVLGNHKITWTGRSRDTALYAVLARDWPEVRARLDARLNAFA